MRIKDMNAIDAQIILEIGISPDIVHGIRYHRDSPNEPGSVYVECLVLDEGGVPIINDDGFVIEHREWKETL